MLRAMRAVSAGRGEQGASKGMLDLHCGNRWSSGNGEIDVLEYAQHMSLMTSVMFGEGFDDGGTRACANRTSGSCGDADWMLLATSGLQFGVFNDMLTDVNLFRGMVFGMWGRPPYSNAVQNSHLWQWIDAVGLARNGTEMLGYWADQPDWHAVVHSNVHDIKATTYLVQPDTVVLAIGSWVATTATVSLRLDTAGIAAKLRGWKPNGKLKVESPAIPMVQNATESLELGSLTMAPRGGALLVVRCK